MCFLVRILSHFHSMISANILHFIVTVIPIILIYVIFITYVVNYLPTFMANKELDI